jgi:uncharacterized coiled-coil protein SlyX
MSARTPNPTKLPGFPKVPSDATPSQRAYFTAIAEALEVRLGRRGDPRDAAVTYRDLLDSGLAIEGPINFGGGQYGGNNGGGINLGNPNDQDGNFNTDPPSDPVAPTGLIVTGGYDVIFIDYDFPFDTYFGHSFTEIWRNDIDQLGSAQLIGISHGMIYVDDVGSDVGFYYWARHVNTNNQRGPWNNLNGTFGRSAVDVEFLLEVLSDAITQSELAGDLSAEIDNIAIIESALAVTNSALTAAQSSVAQAHTDIAQANSDIASALASIGGIQNDIVVIQSVDATQAQLLTGLNTTVGNQSNSITSLQTTTATNASDITNLNTTVGNQSSAITNIQSVNATQAQSITGLQTTVGGQGSSITALQSTTATNAQSITNLNTTVGNQGSSITALQSTSATNAADISSLETTANNLSTNIAGVQTNVNANAGAISGLTTRVTASEGNITSTSNAVTVLQNSIAATNGNVAANASSVSNLNSTVGVLNGQVTAAVNSVNALSTTVGQNTNSVAVNASSINGVLGKYSVTIDSNGTVAGFGLINGTNNSSAFYVNASKFAVGTSPSSGVVPFSVVTSPFINNGMYVGTGTYIQNAMIAAGTIDEVKIGVAAVGSARIKDAAVQTAKIDNLAVTGAKIQDATITGAKIGNAQINTLQLGGEAVTVPRYASNAVSNVYLSGTPVSVCSLWLNGGYVPPGQNARVIIMGAISAYPQNSTVTNLRLHIYTGSTLHNTIAVSFKDYGLSMSTFGSFLIGNNYSNSISLRVSCTSNPGGSSAKSNNSFDCKLIVMSAKR